MTKERLRRYRTLKREAENLRERVEEMEQSIASLRSPSFTGLPSAPGTSSPVEDAVAALVDSQSRYIKKIELLMQEQKAIEDAISSLPDSVERQLMRARYLDGQLWEEVAEQLGYSWQQTHRIHARALQHLTDK